jgi:ribonucleotide monophosphatase NagD (HAD superfamily)
MKKDIPILIDFDGVIRLGSELAADAFEFLNFLQRHSSIINTNLIYFNKELIC